MFALVKKQENATTAPGGEDGGTLGDQGTGPAALGQDGDLAADDFNSQDQIFKKDSDHVNNSSRPAGTIPEPNEPQQSQDGIVPEPKFREVNSTNLGATAADPKSGQGSTFDYYDLFNQPIRNETSSSVPEDLKGADFDYYDELFDETIKNATTSSVPSPVLHNSTRPDSEGIENSFGSLFDSDPEEQVEKGTNGSVALANSTNVGSTEEQGTNLGTLPQEDAVRIDDDHDVEDTDKITEFVIHTSR